MDLPHAFLRNIEHLLGAGHEAFLNSLLETPPTSVRLHPRKHAPFDGEKKVPWCPVGRYLHERPSFTLDPAFHAGSYYVQEASSMFLHHAIAHGIDGGEPLNILDLCAAPGGKSTLLPGVTHPDSLIVSNEVIRSRAGILSGNIRKWGYANVVVTNNDPRDFSRLEGFFDVIVIDAPCSGEGLFRKDPAAVGEWSPENVERCAQRQRRILSDVWPALKENGILIYSTCTYNKLENEANLQWLMNNHGVHFSDLPIEPSWNIGDVREGGVIGWRFFPHRLQGEGFFISVVKKMEASGPPPRAKRYPAFVAAKVRGQVSPWLTDPSRFEFVQHHDKVLAVPAAQYDDAATLIAHLRIVHAGVTVASVKHDKTIPEHPLALCTDLNRESFDNIALNDDDALAYLRKESIHPSDGGRGFGLVTHNDLPLGWINQLGTRSNNLYPTEWRIRMSG